MVCSLADIDREVRELITRHVVEGTAMHETTLREELLALHPETDANYVMLARAHLARSRVDVVLAEFRRQRRELGFDDS